MGQFRTIGLPSTRDAIESIPSLHNRLNNAKDKMHDTLYTRWLYPMISLGDDKWSKGIIAALGALFASETQLVLLVVILVILDFLSGIFAALRRGEKIESWGFRQTGVKTIEYIVLLTGCTMVSNSFEVVNWLGKTAYLFVSLTELKSIFENLFDPSGNASRVYHMLREEITNRVTIAEDISTIEENIGVVDEVADEVAENLVDKETIIYTGDE